MLASYKNNQNLFDLCMILLDKVFPGCKAFAKQGEKLGALWSETSMPFIVEDEGKIIAHLGVIPLNFILNGKNLRIAALHGICVEPEHRGKGLFKNLMAEALDYCQQHFDSVILFTDKPKLYFSFGFKVIEQSDFVVNHKKTDSENSDLKKLDFNNPDDFKILIEMLNKHIRLSNSVEVEQKSLFILNMMDKPIFYSKKLETIISYTVSNNILFIEYLLTKEKHSLKKIAASIPEKFDKIILQFCPDQFPECEFLTIPTPAEDKIMVLDSFNFEGKLFRYPEPYRC